MPLLPFSGPVIPTPVPISRGGTGSATQNFVDLSSTQTVGGTKTFSGNSHFTGTFNYFHSIQPVTNNTYENGDPTAYWSNLYATRTYLNSTAYLDGGTAGQITVTAATNKPFTVNTSNTGDFTQVFNGQAGSISVNNHVQFAVGANGFTNNRAEFNFQYVGNNSYSNNFFFGLSANAAIMGFDGFGQVTLANSTQFTASSGSQFGVKIAPTINQSSTAGYTALLVNTTETATGSGTKLLADFQVGGVSKLNIDNTGKFGGAIQQVLATGASHTVDDVISALQTLGLFKQS